MYSMEDPGQRNFHLIMTLLVVTSFAVDQQDLGGWRPGHVSMVTLGLAAVWIGRFTLDGFKHRDAAAKTLSNRVADLEERVDELERDARSRRGPFPPN